MTISLNEITLVLKNVDMDRLPEELILEISQYLSLESILNLNSVCLYLRNSLNANSLWYDLCKKRFPVEKTDPVLDTGLSHTSPPFLIKNKNKKISDLCQWRFRYMQENWISNNWKCGTYTAEELAQDLVGVDFSDIICNENNLILHFPEEQCFKVWDLKNPVSEEEPIFWSLDSSTPDYCELIDDVFIYVQADILHVYTREEKFHLKYRLCITKGDILKDMSLKDLINFYATECIYLPVFESFCHNRHNFVAAVCETNEIDFYIWDIENAQFFQDRITIACEAVTKIYMKLISKNKLFMEIRGFNDEELTKEIYIYDINLKKFSQLDISDIDQSLITKLNIICIDENANVNFFDKSDCLKQKVVKLNPEFYEYSGQLLEENYPYFVFTKQAADQSIIQIYNTEYKELAGEFLVCDDVIAIQFLTSELLLISCTNYLTIRSEVWDIRNFSKVHTYSFGYFTYASPTKIITFGSTQNKLLILHFW